MFVANWSCERIASFAASKAFLVNFAGNRANILDTTTKKTPTKNLYRVCEGQIINLNSQALKKL